MQCDWYVLAVGKQISLGQVIESTGELFLNNVEMCQHTEKGVKGRWLLINVLDEDTIAT